MVGLEVSQAHSAAPLNLCQCPGLRPAGVLFLKAERWVSSESLLALRSQGESRAQHFRGTSLGTAPQAGATSV